MQKRTIEDIYNKEIGHKKFAIFLTTCKEKNIVVSEIKEYNEKFKFKADGYYFEYQKDTKNVKGIFNMFVSCLEIRKKLGLK